MKLLYIIILSVILLAVITEAGKKKDKKDKKDKKEKGASKKPSGSKKEKKEKKKPSKSKKKPGKVPSKPSKGPPKPGSAEHQAMIEKWFKPFTAKNTGCPCFFDITRTDCACCKTGSGGKACGFPQHQWCYKSKVGGGCPGIEEPKYTLSQTGYPCFYDPKSTECAWCAEGGFQCGDTCVGEAKALSCTKDGSSGVYGDCRHIPGCDLNAECIQTNKEQNSWKCICNKGQTANETFTGNGIQCYNENGVGGDPNKQISVSMMLTTDFYVFPHDSSDFPMGPATDNLFSMIDDMFHSGKPCLGCNATLIQLDGSP